MNGRYRVTVLAVELYDPRRIAALPSAPAARAGRVTVASSNRSAPTRRICLLLKLAEMS